MKGLIFTYALTYGGVLVSLVRPYVGVLIYFCFGVCNPQAMWWWSVPQGSYSRIVAVGLLLGWWVNNFGGWNFGAAKPMAMLIGGYWLWAVVATLTAIDPVAWNFLEPLLKIILPVIVGMTLIDSVLKIKQLAWVLLLSLGYVCYEFNMEYWSGWNRFIKLDSVMAGMDNNSFCIAVVTGTGLAFFLGLVEKIWWRKWLCYILAGLMANVVMFSESRGGMMGLVVTGIMTFFLIAKEPRHYYAFALAFVIGLRLAGPATTARFLSSFADEKERDSSAQSRIVLWGYCWEMMKDNPLLGVGPDCFPIEVANFGFNRGKEAHSLWFQTGAEMGFPGLFFLAGYYFYAIWKLFLLQRRKDVEDPWLIDAARMVVASLTGFVVSASFVSLEGLEFPYYVALIGAGTLKVDGVLRKERAARLREEMEQQTPFAESFSPHLQHA